MNNNLFSYAPKELSTDAFLAWQMKALDTSHSRQAEAAALFYELGLCEKSADSISNVEVSRQEKNTDLIIRYSLNGNRTQALFENKIYTSTHSDQLKRYANSFPDIKYLKYLKLGYTNYAERQEASEAGYDLIDVYRLRTALDVISQDNMILNQYREFLDTQFIKIQDQICNELIRDNKHTLFEDGQAQQHILSELHRAIDGMDPNLYFKHAANSGGTPWTQLDIAKRERAYGDWPEYLFWRIDKRGKGYYLRLNQYSYVGSEHWPQKEANLDILRNRISPLLEEKGLVIGQTSNRGKKESEVVILYFVDNHLTEIMKHLPSLTTEIHEFYSSFRDWV